MEHRSGSDHAHALLGYRSRDPFGTPATAAPERTSDVNFRDVFGGPPRRHSAVYESRRSRTDSLDSRSLRERASDGGGRCLEKPVFGGECGSPARRRHLGDDFFSDIFPGSDSSCSSPVRLDRDAYPLSPGSRVLSPSRPLPPRCEPFVGGSSLPAQLSLSTKLAKGIDQPTFNPPTHPAQYKKDVGSPNAFGVPSSPNASTTQALPVSEDLRNDAYTCYRQSPLSRQVSHDLDKSLEAMDSGSLSMPVPSKKNPTSLEGYIRRHQFHFSIYKWAGKGVTLIMPSNTKDKNDSRFRRLPEVVLQGVDVPSDDDNMPITIIASKNKSENKDSKSLKDLIMNINNDAVSTSVEELLPAGFDSKSLCSDVAEESDTFSDNSKKNPVAMHGGLQPKMKNLRQLFKDDVKKHGNEDTVRQVNKTDNFYGVQQNVYDGASAKQHAGKENSLHHVEVVSPSMKDVQVSLDDKMLGGRVKGKVKDFIKIFNQEASPKHKGIVETQYRKSRGKDRVKSKVEGQVGTTAPKTVEEVKASSRASEINMVKEAKADSIISNESLRDTPITMNQNLKAEKPDSTMRSDVNMINDSSSRRKEDSGPCFEPTPITIDDLECNIEESHCEDLEGCLVEQLTREQNDHLQTNTHQDQIKASDAKISEWSKGKEGNIRSMLSTLQYVLWPESGWKPVPLVDIIEGASVKRAYQKALLCLHPDKLQQKGADIHQKYIAEKVFDILQEAWEHFNSVSSF